MRSNLFSNLFILFLILLSCKNDAPFDPKSKKNNDVNSLFIKIKGRENLLVNLSLKGIYNQSNNIEFLTEIIKFSDQKYLNDSTWKNQNLDSGLTIFLSYIHKLPFEEPKNANYLYKEKKFELINEVQGYKLDTAQIRVRLTQIIKSKGKFLDLELDELYIKPKFTSKSKDLLKAKKNLEKSLSSIINLTYESDTFRLDKEIFGSWISLDSNLKVKLDFYLMQLYLQNLATKIESPLSEILLKYDIADTTIALDEITFLRINISKEIDELTEIITKGRIVSKKLLMVSRGLPKGIKDGLKDFLEVSLTQQKLWLFKNGNLLLETDVVTGNERLNRHTPTGNYTILSKVRNKTLRGIGYEAFVSYWMPFYKGYGLHDANWRRRFGSSIYENQGSHGCINIPPRIVPMVYQNVEIGMPIIIY
jgi:hypothetical protein